MQSSKPHRLFFSGSSFLGVYDVGVVVGLLDHGKKLLNQVETYGGVSAGALAAAVTISSPERLLQYFDAILTLCTKIHSLPQGAMTPGFDLVQEIRHILEAHLKDTAHAKCSTRLHVPLHEVVATDGVPVDMRRRQQNLQQELQALQPPTKTDIVVVDGKEHLFGQKHVVTEFGSKQSLVEVLLSAIFYPTIPTVAAPVVKGKHFVDVTALSGTPGDAADCGFPSVGHVIAIAPNKNAGLVRPRDNLTTGLRDVSRENYIATPWHMFRMGAGLYPPPREELEKKFLDGVTDAKEFLRKIRLFDEGEDSYPYKAPLY